VYENEFAWVNEIFKVVRTNYFVKWFGECDTTIFLSRKIVNILLKKSNDCFSFDPHICSLYQKTVFINYLPKPLKTQNIVRKYFF